MFDIEGARAAGYTDDEIKDFLSQQQDKQPSFDVQGAKAAGYSEDEINSYLGQGQSGIPSPEEQARLSHTTTQITENPNAPQWKRNVSQIARPTLEALGLVGGGLAGSAAAPIAGTLAGAGLGYAAGSNIANRLDEAMGLTQPQSLGQAFQQAGTDVLSGAAQEMGGQIAGKVIPAVAKGVGKLFSQPAGVSTGVGAGAIEEAFKGNPLFQKGINGEIGMDDVVGQVNSKLDSMIQGRATAYQDALKNVQGATKTLDVAPIESKLAERLKIFGLNMSKELPEELKGMNMKGFSPEAIAEMTSGAETTLKTTGARGAGVAGIGQDAVNVLKNFQTEGDFTPYGFDTLRMNLQAIAQDSPKARVMLRPVIEDIRNSVEAVAPGYKKMLADYEKTTNKINELQSALNIRGEGVSQDTIIRKLSTIFRDVNKYRLAKLDELDPNGDLRAAIAGVAMRSGLPRGQLSRLLHLGSVGGVGMLTHNPALAGGLLAVSSPWLVGKTSYGLGKAYNAIPSGLGEAAFRNWLLDYANQQGY